VTTPLGGAYELVVQPAAFCRFPAASYSVAVVAATTMSGSRAELRATLPGGDSTLTLSMLYPSPGTLRGSISTRRPVAFAGGPVLFLRTIGSGTVSLGAGGRAEVVDGSMIGDVGVTQGGSAFGTCTSGDHRWSLRAR
jgi:hypothetical protein